MPPVDGLMLMERGVSRQVNVINFKMEKSIVYNFAARPTREGTVKIPEMTIDTSEGQLTIPEAVFRVSNATNAPTPPVPQQGNSSTRSPGSADLLFSRLTIEDGVLWKGEVAEVQYDIKGVSSVFQGVASSPEWEPSQLVFGGWDEDISEFNENIDNRNYRVGRYTSRVLADEVGVFDVPPVEQIVILRSRGSGIATFDRFFGRQERRRLVSDSTKVKVKDLPENAPSSFTGAVGQFEIEQDIVPQERVRVGDPITWTVRIKGKGNWPMEIRLPVRSVSKDFRAITPDSKMILDEGSEFSGQLSEDVVLIPEKAGTYTLGPLEWSYFEPDSGAYKTITLPSVTLEIEEADPSVARIPAVSGPVSEPRSFPDNQVPPRSEKNLTPDQMLPRELKSSSGGLMTPWSLTLWLSLCSLPILSMLGVWLFFSRRHAPQTDRLRKQRSAAQEITNLLSGDQGQSDPLETIRRWRRLTCERWKISSPVPQDSEIHSEILTAGFDSETAELWASLWSEAEAALYHADQVIPEDWMSRARQAALDAPVSSCGWWQAFYPRNLFPMTLILFLVALSPLQAAEIEAAYQKGDFVGVEENLRKELSQDKGDWEDFYNLGLVNIQQADWSEAAAFSLAAFLQESEEDVRWNARLARNQSGAVLAILDAPLIFVWLSPAECQIGALIMITLSALFFILWIWRRYCLDSKSVLSRFSLIALILSVLGLVYSITSYLNYEKWSDPDVALIVDDVPLRSIPSEVDEQTQSALPAGTGAVIKKEFLGWRQVRLESGQEGWVRKESLIPLYGSDEP